MYVITMRLVCISFRSFRLASECVSVFLSCCCRNVVVALTFSPIFNGHLPYSVSVWVFFCHNSRRAACAQKIMENIVLVFNLDGRESMHTYAYTYNLLYLYHCVRDSLIAVKWHLIMNLIKMCVCSRTGRKIARIYENPITISAIIFHSHWLISIFSKVSLLVFLHIYIFFIENSSTNELIFWTEMNVNMWMWMWIQWTRLFGAIKNKTEKTKRELMIIHDFSGANR